MKKTLLITIISFSIINMANAQWATSGTNLIYSGGNVGIGVNNPLHKLSVAGNLWLTTADNSMNASLATTLGNFLSIEAFNNTNTAKYPVLLNPWGGKTGINTTNPLSIFQVSDGPYKTSIGQANGPDLAYGTSYIGFNAARNISSWTINQDGANNGGAVIFSSIFGDIYFSNIETTGASDKTLSDPEIKNRVQFRIGHDGTIYAKAIKVQTSIWADYVFKKDYSLLSLSDLKSYIDKNQHLPDMPSSEEVVREGINVGEMNHLLLKKVEELTLYLLEKDRTEKEYGSRIKNLESQIDQNKTNAKLHQDQIDQMKKQIEALLAKQS